MWQSLRVGRGLRDEEHSQGARITLECDVDEAPYRITCGIYGWMLHTRFFSTDDEAEEAYAAMKVDLDLIVRAIPLKSDPEVDAKSNAVSRMINAFVTQYP